MMQKPKQKPRGPSKSPLQSRTLQILVIAVVAILAYSYVIGPLFFAPKPRPVGPAIFLNPSTDIRGTTIGISGKELLANHSVTAMFDNTSLPLSGTCTTDRLGNLTGCTFVVTASTATAGSQHTVTVSDGTHNPSATFSVPSIVPPESTILVSATSLGLGLLTQLVTKRVVNLDVERRMKAELAAFNKEKREATLAKDAVKLEKLKKRQLSMSKEQSKVQIARFKVTIVTIVPLFLIYYLMASFLGGYGVVVGHSPIPIPYIVNGDGSMGLFGWYLLSSFMFSSLLIKALRTGT